MSAKPLGHKAYGSIGHLPQSRMGPADKHVHDGQARICTERARRGDRVLVQEKLDGSCCAVARINGEIVALGRAGYRAETSRFEQHHLFARWVMRRASLFREILFDGERLVGEWLAQAHSTRYELDHEPFVPFDLMSSGHVRTSFDPFMSRTHPLTEHAIVSPALLSSGGPISVDCALDLLGEYGHHGATDRVEGVIYRVELDGRVDFIAKYVRPDKIDGIYLPEISGGDAVWNWWPRP